jgi:hypothetical protein
MPTTAEPRPGLVLPEYGPSAPELVRRRFKPRTRRLLYAALALFVAALALLLLGRGDGLTELEHTAAPQFTLLYPPSQVHKVKAGPGEILRFRSGRGRLRMVVAMRRLTLPPYQGSVGGLLPVLADRQAAALARELPGFRLLADGKARVNDAPGYQLRYRGGRTQGTDVFVVPEDGDREGLLLRLRQTNPPSGLGQPQKDLVKATKKAFRSFRFGLDRP